MTRTKAVAFPFLMDQPIARWIGEVGPDDAEGFAGNESRLTKQTGALRCGERAGSAASVCRVFRVRRRVARAHRLGFHPSPPSQQPGGKHFCIVKNQQVIRAQEPGEIAESPVRQMSGRPFHLQQPRCRSIRQGRLSNQLFGQMEVEIGDQHAPIIEKCLWGNAGREMPLKPNHPDNF